MVENRFRPEFWGVCFHVCVIAWQARVFISLLSTAKYILWGLFSGTCVAAGRHWGRSSKVRTQRGRLSQLRWKHRAASELYFEGSGLRTLADLQTEHWKLWTDIHDTFKKKFSKYSNFYVYTCFEIIIIPSIPFPCLPFLRHPPRCL